MVFRMITWDADKFEKLQHAAEQAARHHQATFYVDLDRKHTGVAFNTVEALGLIAQLESDFARNPTPVFRENREGREP